MNVDIRRCADPSGQPEIVTLAVESYADLDAPTREDVVCSLAGMSRLGSLTCLQATVEGRTAGFIAGWPRRFALRPDRPTWKIEWLAVSSDRRGRGLGRELMDAYLGLAADQDVAAVWLWTWERAPAALGLYRSCGFDVVRRVQVQLGGDAREGHENRWVLVNDLG